MCIFICERNWRCFIRIGISINLYYEESVRSISIRVWPLILAEFYAFYFRSSISTLLRNIFNYLLLASMKICLLILSEAILYTYIHDKSWLRYMIVINYCYNSNTTIFCKISYLSNKIQLIFITQQYSKI